MTSILVAILRETLMALIGKVAFKAILERAITRVVIKGLEKLADMSTNTLAHDTVVDIIDSLKGKKLKVVDGVTL